MKGRPRGGGGEGKNHSQLEPGADVVDEAAVGSPEVGLLVRADAVPPRRRAALDLLPGQVPRPGPLAAASLLRRVAAHRDPRRRRRRRRLRNRKRPEFFFFCPLEADGEIEIAARRRGSLGGEGMTGEA